MRRVKRVRPVASRMNKKERMRRLKREIKRERTLRRIFTRWQ